MSLSELMSSMELDAFPQAALVIFAGVFLLVGVRAITLGRRQNVDRLARIVLDETEAGDAARDGEQTDG